MAEEFTGPVDIDGTPAEPGLLRVNGQTLPPMGAIRPIDTTGHGEIECGHLLAHGDGPQPAANFGSHVGVEGNIDVSGSVSVGGDVHVKGDVISEKLTEIERRISDLHNWVQLPDGRSVVGAVQDLTERVKKLEHDAKPVLDGGPVLPP